MVTDTGPAPRGGGWLPFGRPNGPREEPAVAWPLQIGAWLAFVVLLLPVVIVVLAGLNSAST